MTAEKDTENITQIYCPFGGLVTQTGFVSCSVYHLAEFIYYPGGDQASFACIRIYLWVVESNSLHFLKRFLLERLHSISHDLFERFCERSHGPASSVDADYSR